MQVYRKRQPGGPALHHSEQNASQQSESLHTSRGKTHIRHQQGNRLPYCSLKIIFILGIPCTFNLIEKLIYLIERIIFCCRHQECRHVAVIIKPVLCACWLEMKDFYSSNIPLMISSQSKWFSIGREEDEMNMTILLFVLMFTWLKGGLCVGLGEVGEGRAWERAGSQDGADSPGEVGAACPQIRPQGSYEGDLAKREPETRLTGVSPINLDLIVHTYYSFILYNILKL